MLGDFLELSAAGGAEDAQSLTSFAWLARQADTRVYAGCCPTTLASGASQSAQGVQSSVGECKGVFGERGKAQLASMYALTAETLDSAFRSGTIPSGKEGLWRRLSSRTRKPHSRFSGSGRQAQEARDSQHPAFEPIEFAAHIARMRIKDQDDGIRSAAQTWVSAISRLFDACLVAYQDGETTHDGRQATVCRLLEVIQDFNAVENGTELQSAAARAEIEDKLLANSQIIAQGIDPDVANMLLSSG